MVDKPGSTANLQESKRITSFCIVITRNFPAHELPDISSGKPRLQIFTVDHLKTIVEARS